MPLVFAFVSYQVESKICWHDYPDQASASLKLHDYTDSFWKGVEPGRMSNA